MKCYFAPLEGVTGYVFRNAHRDFFDPADKYFSPFIVPKPNTGKRFGAKEMSDILPEHNRNLYLVPQIMTKHAEDFIHTAKALEELGYREVNLNLGCPSRTVVSKGRGSGFLAKPEELESFLDEIFSALSMKISIKTRIGKDSPREFERLISIYNKYPLEELIIHPRVQKDYYNGTPDIECFQMAWNFSKNPVCYNGDIFCVEDLRKIKSICPKLDRVMMGRGLLANPGLIGEIHGKGQMDPETFHAFHDRLMYDYQAVFYGDKNVLFKMKEFWYYAIWMFEDSEKFGKRIRKMQKLNGYRDVVNELFENRKMREHGGFRLE